MAVTGKCWPVLAALLLCAPALAVGPVLIQRDGVLGTSFEMQVAGSQRQATQAADAALAEVERLQRLLSTWREDSELSRYNAGALQAAQLSADTRTVLGLCEQWRRRSEGAFSCRLGALAAQWRAADADDRLPDRTALRQQARALAALEVSDTAALDPATGLRFDVDGVAKGYILDAALARARAAAPDVGGIRIDIGGDAVYWGLERPGEPWRVGVADPQLPVDNAAPLVTLQLEARQAVAASGHHSRGYRVGRRKFSHIINPQDGRPLSYAPAAIVVAPDAATADALATALTVLPVRSGLSLVEEVEGAAALIVSDAGVRFASARWPALLPADPAHAAALPGEQQLQIDYTIPQRQGQGYRQPYLAIWIEREDGTPLRQLHVLGDRSRWLGELPRWWRHYGRNDPAAALGLARPTRAPGQYTVGWDGRDDLGVAQPAGRYVLWLEAAREHGGHDLASIPFVLGANAVAEEYDGQGELGPVRLRVRPGAP